jgi:hypothetical protein
MRIHFAKKLEKSKVKATAGLNLNIKKNTKLKEK